MKHLFTFAAAAVLAVACGGSTDTNDGNGAVSRGGGGGSAGTGGGTNGGSGGSAYEPCANQPCGSQCSPCDPADPTCVGPAVVMFCDAAGECSSTYPTCVTPSCRSTADCPQPLAACQACPDGSYACPSVECINGECVGSFPTCQGTTCVSDSDCPQSLAPCQLCPDGTSACPWSRCENGLCVSGVDSCATTDPCTDKACGDPCNPCDGIPGCLGPPSAMYCDANLTCQVGPPPICGGTASCTSDADCPGVGACPMCPDGQSCAELHCINGACEFACPSTGLNWYTTCGDPVCTVGTAGSSSGYPPCTTEIAGEACTQEGTQCNLGSCGATLLCTTTDPTVGGCPISRAKYKQDIEYVTNEERAKLAEDVQTIPIVRYRYKGNPEREHLGFIIEDVEPSPSVDSKADRVDLYGYTTMTVAAIQEQQREIEALRREVESLKAEVDKARAGASK